MTRWKMTIEIDINGKIVTPVEFGKLVYTIFERVNPDKKFNFQRVVLEAISDVERVVNSPKPPKILPFLQDTPEVKESPEH